MMEPGRKISHYRLVAMIGQGGMGEVYRARDDRLERDVALKVLPSELASDPERISRFRREAQLLASLNHPNIASLFGMEESEGTCWLVMELVEGPTLESRIESGLSQEESLGIARQMAEALEAAHAKGVVHRDLKPGNVKLDAEGRVKVLDFGLAKALARDPVTSSSAIAHSPTRASLTTQAGVLLGTAAYMSPEQARGSGVDRRSDIWSFGCVLFEMLTGARPFESPTSSDAVAHLLLSEPDWTLLGRRASPRIVRLVRRCLQKDARRRWHDIADVRVEIEEVLAGAEEEASPVPVAAPRASVLGRAGWAATAVLIAVSGFLLVKLLSSRPSPALPVSLSLVLPAERALVLEQHPSVALSPNGRVVVFTALEPPGKTNEAARRTMLYRRPIDRFDSEPIAGTEGAFSPFFSPDGRFLAFFADGQLMKVPVDGGSPTMLCEAPLGYGGRWIEGGTIVFAPQMSGGLYGTTESGGACEPITTLRPEENEVSHRWPEVLPDGETILFTVKTGRLESFDDASIVAMSLSDGARRTLIQGGSFPRLAGSGLLAYARAGALQAISFDARTATVTGTPRALAGDLATNPYSGAAQFDLAGEGMIAYVPGVPLVDLAALVMVGPTGSEQTLTNERYPFSDPRLSPDGDRVVLWISSANDNIWLYDLEQSMLTRLTFGSGNDYQPAWIGDGSHIAFLSDRDGTPDLFLIRVDGGEPEKLLEADTPEGGPLSWSPVGNTLMYVISQPETGSDLWVLPLEGDRRPRLFLGTPFNESSPAFSPDGRWVAYASDESGRSEIYVQQWPGPGRKWRVSQEGGSSPLWPRDDTLYYREGSAIMAVSMVVQPRFRAGTPRRLFVGPYSGGFDVTRDGRGLVMVRPEEERTPHTRIHLIMGGNF